MRPNGIITLTTDFGLIDSYVGTMKGVMLGIAPTSRLIDITHAIEPQNLHQAAYILHSFYRYYPAGSVHLAVIDPGVGSSRRAIALQTPTATFVAPDNGVLTYIWRDLLAEIGREACHLVELDQRDYWLPHVSKTFHGRDIFAPVAAHLAAGVAIEKLGTPIATLTEAALEQPTRGRNGELIGRIIHVDTFGNCITNIRPRHIGDVGHTDLLVQIIDQHIVGLKHTYAEGAVGDLIALIGSSDHLELAVRNGSAAKRLGVGIGDQVRVRAASG
ncbi:MAG TPA: SAM-dependent chlorinase/fluorinase [Roseiflexaceae bacterium]|nr:SAM-dependent chlorinase/fluorinase [Roseiflexaceae bacterium]HMP41543.1 SAM-dependent chlorinase/fluorinase [Roseiflexaceae bacterium]